MKIWTIQFMKYCVLIFQNDFAIQNNVSTCMIFPFSGAYQWCFYKSSHCLYFYFYFYFFFCLSNSDGRTECDEDVKRDSCVSTEMYRTLWDLFYSIVLYCIVLYWIVLYCIIMSCVIMYCIVLYCFVLYCTMLYYFVLYCTVL